MSVVLLKTLFIISISTSRMIFPAVPILPDQQPDAPMHPKSVSKSITMSLTSPKTTTEIPSVKVTVPEGLQVGPFVKLRVELPKPSAAAATDAAASALKTKLYWGEGEKIPAGQPKIENAESIIDTQQSGSLAYWPIGYHGEKLPKPDSKVEGVYDLTSNFCGDAAVTIGSDQNYLDAIELIGITGEMDPSKPYKITWKRVPNTVGYVVSAFGGNDTESVYWTSSSDPDKASKIETSPVTKDMVESYISKGYMLKPDVTSCTIPADVLKGAEDIMITVTAVGTDKIQTGADVDTQVLVRSITSAALAAK